MPGINAAHQESILKLPPPDTVRREPGTEGIVFSFPCQHRWSVVCKEILQEEYDPFVQNLLCVCPVLAIYSKHLSCAGITLGANWAPQT